MSSYHCGRSWKDLMSSAAKTVEEAVIHTSVAMMTNARCTVGLKKFLAMVVEMCGLEDGLIIV